MANVITVTALNQYVKTLLEHDAVLTDIAIRGEISNFVNHFKTGHFYFSIKDEACTVKCVMFRTYAQKLAFTPENGIRVILRGRISLYERDGAFQIYADDMFPDGVGAMQLAFDQLKAKLEKEGLFAAEHKRALPSMPRCVGLVTSKTGAAIQDVYNVTARRNPLAHFLLAPVTVQGNDSAPAIARAIERLDKSGKVDVIIVARGGGSREDLWVFNAEIIARAAYASSTPVVSAIGHEIDFSILDFVADLRAPTPSAAAELVMPDVQTVYENACKIFMNIQKSIQIRQQIWYNSIVKYQNAPQLETLRALPRAKTELLCREAAQLRQCVHRIYAKKTENQQHHAALCETLNPYGVLARGYCVAKDEKGNVVRDAAVLSKGDALQVLFAKGAARCTVEQIWEKEREHDAKKEIL